MSEDDFDENVPGGARADQLRHDATFRVGAATRQTGKRLDLDDPANAALAEKVEKWRAQPSSKDNRGLLEKAVYRVGEIVHAISPRHPDDLSEDKGLDFEGDYDEYGVLNDDQDKADKCYGPLANTNPRCAAEEQEYHDIPYESGVDHVKSASVWDQQCFLVENIKRLSKLGAIQSFKNFGILEGQPGSIVSTLNRGPLSEKGVDQLLNLSPSTYAYLVPHIKLYRVLYDRDDPLKIIGEQEMPIENYTSLTDFETMMKSQAGRQAGSGLKSFTWKLEGVQPEEVDNNITATLEMHFQSLQDLFRYSLDPGSDDPLTGGAGRENPSFLDLIIAPESAVHIRGGNVSQESGGQKKCSENKDASMTYEGALYRIKIVVGWAVPDLEGLDQLRIIDPETNDPELGVEELRSALESQRTTLFLQLARHNLTFLQDGVVKLTVEYQAALNGILRSEWSNIFAHPEALRNIFQEDPEAADLMERYQKKEFTADSEEGRLLEGYLDRQIALEQEDRLVKYRRILESIYANGKISAIRVGTKTLLEPSWADLTPQERSDRARNRQSDNSAKRGFTIYPVGTSTESDPTELLKNVEKLDKEEIERMGKGFKSITKATPADNIDIHYFYLGDLIDSILELPQIRKNLLHKNYQIMLGTVEYVDPLVAYQIKNIDEIMSCGGVRNVQQSVVLDALNPLSRKNMEGIVEHISMASIPISVNAFNQWFFNRVIKKGLTKYHLDQFIRDMLAALVGRALSARCFSHIPQVPLRFATNDFFLNMKHPVAGNRLHLDTVRDLIEPEFKPGIPFASRPGSAATWRRHSGNIPTLFIYSTDSLPVGRGGALDWQADHDRGIYHFYLGASSGLVKKIDFQREDMPYFREAKIHKKGALGATQLRELYKVKMTMIGNTLLKNGQYIYINPTAIGAGSPNARQPNVAKLLGLGGYFLVTSVNHRISEAGFEVSIEALHQSVPEGTGQSIPVVAHVDTRPADVSGNRAPKKKRRVRGGVTPGSDDSPRASSSPKRPPTAREATEASMQGMSGAERIMYAAANILLNEYDCQVNKGGKRCRSFLAGETWDLETMQPLEYAAASGDDAEFNRQVEEALAHGARLREERLREERESGESP